MSGVLDPGSSPQGNSGTVRRLNKLPMIIAFAVMCVVVFGIVYALYARSKVRELQASQAAAGSISNNAMADKLLAGVGDGIADSHSETIIIDNTQPTPELPPAETVLPTEVIAEEQPKEDEEARRIAGLVREFRERGYYDALVSGTAVAGKPAYDEGQDGQKDPAQSLEQTRSALQAAALGKALGGQGIAAPGLDGMESLLGERDPNLRLRKAAFAETDNPYGYRLSVREAQLTPYEIRVGTIIPAVMISGINSDLPGDIIAQVSHNVYDSKTGRHVLIPQGSKLIGRYDSHIAMGQERVMIAWHRLQFPDASVFNLGNMGAVDLAGYAGMHDQVNNHTWKIFKGAFLLSVIGAGSQIAIGSSDRDENSPLNVTKSELGRQFGQVGTEMIKRNLNIQPTLEIRPGYRFNVMVNKDLILQPYQAM